MTALLTAPNRVGVEKYATAQNSLFYSICLLSPALCPCPLLIQNVSTDNMTSTCNGSLSNIFKGNFYSGSSHFLKLPQPLNLCCFNVRTLMRTRQEECLTMTMNSISIDTCDVSETPIQDSTILVQLTVSNAFSRYLLRISGDEIRVNMAQE